jgi:hypothetical protein
MSNVARYGGGVGVESPPVDRCTDDELAHILTAARDEHFYPAILTLARTGLRAGEACGLRWRARQDVWADRLGEEVAQRARPGVHHPDRWAGVGPQRRAGVHPCPGGRARATRLAQDPAGSTVATQLAEAGVPPRTAQVSSVTPT